MSLTVGYHGSPSRAVCIEPARDVGFGELGPASGHARAHTPMSPGPAPRCSITSPICSHFGPGLAFCFITSPALVDLEEHWPFCSFFAGI